MIELNLVPRDPKKSVGLFCVGIIMLLLMTIIIILCVHFKKDLPPVSVKKELISAPIPISQIKIVEPTEIDFQHVSVQMAIHAIAKHNHFNVIISPEVSGMITLHLQNMSAEQAFNLILNTRDLVRLWQDQAWYILPRSEWMRQKQEELKLQTVLDQTAPLIMHVWQLHYAKAEEMLSLVRDTNGTLLSKRGSIHVDSRTNSLCAEDTALAIAAMNQLIEQMDVPVQQVRIETRLTSIDYDFERELGVHFSVAGGEGAGLSRYSLAVAKLADGAMLDMQLAALENEGHAELISRPSLFTANQQTAYIEAGEEIPYQEISRSGATGVAFKKAVLSLKVTPQVLPDHKVLLDLQINQDKPSSRIILGVPAITTRQMSTHVLVTDGQTIVLGGIFESSNDRLEERIPFVSKIPLVGLLFRQQNVAENKRELLIFVTPKIIDVTGNQSEIKT